MSLDAATPLGRALLEAERYKGYPWSESEYRCHVAMEFQRLLDACGLEVAEEFKRRCDALPQPKRFNNWSGD